MKLLCEINESNEVLTEAVVNETGGRDYYISGIFMQANIPNRNGRLYPTEILDREVARYNEQFVNKGRAMGELGHPQGPTINLDRVSHKIISLYRDGDNFIGKAKILSTQFGETAKRLIDDGITLGVSSRGLGTCKKRDGLNIVEKNFYLATAADIVADPSAPDALVTALVEEVDWVFTGGNWVPKFIDESKKYLSKKTDKSTYQKKVEVFEKYMKHLSKTQKF